jgi:hypothetical protein
MLLRPFFSYSFSLSFPFCFLFAHFSPLACACRICGRNPILLAMQTLGALPTPHAVSFLCYAQSSECGAMSGEQRRDA